jgi:hypothetical protein
MSSDIVILLLVFIFLSVIQFLGLAGLILFLSRDTTRIPELISRLTNVENLTQQLASDVNAEQLNMGGMQEIWRTPDGKYQADSFEGLVSKMANDPEGPLSPDEIDTIKSLFNKILGQPDNDNDEPEEPWKRRG